MGLILGGVVPTFPHQVLHTWIINVTITLKIIWYNRFRLPLSSFVVLNAKTMKESDNERANKNGVYRNQQQDSWIHGFLESTYHFPLRLILITLLCDPKNDIYE